MRVLKIALLVGGGAMLVFLVTRIGMDSIVATLSHLAWWHLIIICLPHGAVTVLDTLGWRYAFCDNRVPFASLLGARIVGNALNLVTAVASVGGEAAKAWLVRRHAAYAESIPSLVIAKTAGTIAQSVFVVVSLGIATHHLELDSQFARGIGWLLLLQSVCVGGFLLTQVTGVIGRAGRWLSVLGLTKGASSAQRLDQSLRHFYRHHRRRLLLSIALMLLGWVLGGVEAALILYMLGVSSSLSTAMLVEAFGAAIRFATFLVPASLGALEGANAGAFALLGFGAGAGLAFSLVRRARQAVWVGIGLVVLLLMRARGAGGTMPDPAR